MNKFRICCLAALSLFWVSCENQMPFGPSYDYDANMARDLQIIDQHLATAHYDSLYRVHDPSGVVVIVHEEGTGSRPNRNSFIYTNYIGRLLDQSVFDTNLEDVAREHGLFNESRDYAPFAFSMSGTSQAAIEGFIYGFLTLRSGSKATMIIPSPLAYRNNPEIERIPPDSVIEFEVHFLGMD